MGDHEHHTASTPASKEAAQAPRTMPIIKNADPTKLSPRASHEKATPKRSALEGKAAAASTKQAGDSDDRAKAQAIITGYRAAQHEVDTKASRDDVYMHLDYVRYQALNNGTGQADSEQVKAAADSFAHALRAASPRYEDLVEVNQQIRTALGLTAPSKARTNLAGGSDASYGRAAIGPALDTFAGRTNTALKWIELTKSDDDGLRTSSIEVIAGDAQITSEYVLGLLEQLQPDERSRVATKASNAARSIGRVLRLVRTWPSHRSLEVSLLRGVDAFDHALMKMGAEPIADRDEVPLTEGQRHATETEQAGFDHAYEATKGAIRALIAKQHSKIDLLKGIAGLEDLPEPPTFMESLMKAALDALLSYSIGEFAKILGTRMLPAAETVSLPPAAKTVSVSPAAKTVSLPPAAQTVSLPPAAKVPAGGENVFSIGGGALKTAVAAKLGEPPPSGVDKTKLALQYFCAALHDAETTRGTAYITKLGAQQKQSVLSVARLQEIESVVNSEADNLLDGYYQRITTSWAQYLAHSRLGATRIQGRKVSKMKDYFGKQQPGGRMFGTSQAGGGGVLSVVLRLEAGAAKPTLDPSATKIIGLNSALKSQVLAAASYELDKVELPKEIRVEAEFARATIALDEQNRVRDVINWHELSRHVGGITAYRFWQLFGKGLTVS